MKAQSLFCTRFLAWLTPALVVGLLGCGKNTTSSPPGAQADAAQLSDGPRNTTGGSTSNTGGASSGSGGATGAGGATTGTGGITSSNGGASTGGTTIGTGGTTSSNGGSKNDANPIGTGGAATGGAATGGVATGGVATGGVATGGAATGGATTGDAGTAKDGGADAQRDAALDSGSTPGDALLADSGPPQGDGGISVPDGYKLVWSDEFNVDGTPDPKNWNYERGFVRNSELQWYQPNNATVKGGLLIIEGRKEQVANPNYVAGSTDWKLSRQYAQYTSTSMTTSGLQTWQYGRFEMRGRIPTGAGMWPAWWALGVSGEWPSNGEIDMMEFYKGNVLANVACGTATRWVAKWDGSAKAVSSLGANWSSNFHVWRMDWDDQNINLYLDDVLLNGVPLSTMLNADGTSPFKQKDYMILNLAIGGINGGDPAATTFPVRFEVDYVRVFQKL